MTELVWIAADNDSELALVIKEIRSELRKPLPAVPRRTLDKPRIPAVERMYWTFASGSMSFD